MSIKEIDDGDCPYFADICRRLDELSDELDRLEEGRLSGQRLEFETMDQLRIRLLEVRLDYLEQVRPY
jgi:hypothetical protein